MYLKKKPTKKKIKIAYHRKPEEMQVEKWQKILRKQFAETQNFSYENLGTQPVFSDYLVHNPVSDKVYKVSIRDNRNSYNFCSCPDFKTNLLGTCKHIEFILYNIEKKASLKKILSKGYEPPYSSISLKYGAERKVYLRIGKTNRSAIKDLSKDYFDKDNYIKQEAFEKINIFINKIKLLDPAFRCYDDALNFIIEMRDKKKRDSLLEFKYKNNQEALDKLSKAKLYPYQKEGVLFIYKAGRCLLADDMGLGKTVQSIVAAELFIKEQNIEKILIICPTSLKHQWKNEIKKFTGKEANLIEGPPHIRYDKYFQNDTYKITTYHCIINDYKTIEKYAPDLIILDEAQRIKNWKTKTAQSIKALNSKYAIVLTGTPLENRIEELHSIMQFVDNYRLGPLYKFINYHQIIEGATNKVVGYQHLNEIRTTLEDVLLRRNKKEILTQLPDRVDNNYFVSVTPEQRDWHNDFAKTVNRIVDKWHKQGFLNEEDKRILLISLNCMRMLADSTYILDQKTRFDTKIEELLIVLKDILENDNNKVVIFSQWERMTRLVANELDKYKIKYEYLHGGIPGNKRGKLLDNFRDNPEIKVFLSTDAGGVGLNLQAASFIINLDLPWNPAVLEQRISRIHRLGQKNSVNVINFVSTGTIEHRMLFLLDFKKTVFAGVLDMGNDMVFMGEDRFTQFMKSVEELTKINIETNDNKDEPVIEPETELPPEQLELFTENLNKDNIIIETYETLAEPETLSEDNLLKTTDIINDKETAPALPIEPENNEKDKPVEDKPLNPSAEESQKPIHPENPINELLGLGLKFLNQLSQSLNKQKDGEATELKNTTSGIVQRDEKTGENYIKIPLNDNTLITKISSGIEAFLKAFNKNE